MLQLCHVSVYLFKAQWCDCVISHAQYPAMITIDSISTYGLLLARCLLPLLDLEGTEGNEEIPAKLSFPFNQSIKYLFSSLLLGVCDASCGS